MKIRKTSLGHITYITKGIMELKICLVFCIVLLQALCPSLTSLPFERDLSRGFGNQIEWVSLEDALVEAHKKTMPIFLLIHSENCPACMNLKPRFATNPDITTLSQYFQMVNVIGDEEPMDEMFTPDGLRYYPRILFLTPDGDVVPQLTNTHKDNLNKYAYYYYTAEQVVEGMLNGLNAFYEFEDEVEDL